VAQVPSYHSASFDISYLSEKATLMSVHLMGVYLTGVHLTSMYLTGVHLASAHFIGVHLMVVHLMRASHECQDHLSNSGDTAHHCGAVQLHFAY